jgi:dephospho-CoA kinase
MQSSQKIGLTGGIGSGKSTVARMLVDCGAALIDADAISREATAPGGAAIAQVARQFGPKAITPEGAMDRDVMRDLAFSDPAVKRQLEAIIHPLVSLESARLAAAAAHAGSACILFDIPLLVESNRWRQQLDQVVVVDCTEATQISRVMARQSQVGMHGHWTCETVQKVMASQASRAHRRAAADACIYNDGLSLDALGTLVKQLSRRFGL